MVLTSGAGTTTMVFLSTPISTRCGGAQLQGQWMGEHHIRGGPELVGGQRLTSAAMILARFSCSASA